MLQHGEEQAPSAAQTAWSSHARLLSPFSMFGSRSIAATAIWSQIRSNVPLKRVAHTCTTRSESRSTPSTQLFETVWLTPSRETRLHERARASSCSQRLGGSSLLSQCPCRQHIRSGPCGLREDRPTCPRDPSAPVLPQRERREPGEGPSSDPSEACFSPPRFPGTRVPKFRLPFGLFLTESARTQPLLARISDRCGPPGLPTTAPMIPTRGCR